VVIYFATSLDATIQLIKIFMKKTIIIILAVSIYSTVLSFTIDTLAKMSVLKSGSTYQLSQKTQNGYKCIIDYVDKSTKESLFTGFENVESKSCSDTPKIIEINQQEALQILQTRLNDKSNSKIIIPPDNLI
jgi:heptaprenylglyceryl phosphate synthase